MTDEIDEIGQEKYPKPQDPCASLNHTETLEHTISPWFSLFFIHVHTQILVVYIAHDTLPLFLSHSVASSLTWSLLELELTALYSVCTSAKMSELGHERHPDKPMHIARKLANA